MSENSFSENVSALFQGMDSFLSTRTVVGDAMRIDEHTVILPLVDISFGMGAGSYASDKKTNGAGGLGGRVMPSAVLVIHDGMIRVINVRNMDAINRVIDMVPDLFSRFVPGGDEKRKADEDILHQAFGEEESGKEKEK